jgi:hypothetical protein
MSRTRVVLSSLLAVFAVGAVAAASAQAEPLYYENGAALAAPKNVRYTSMWSRLWSYKQKLVIVCKSDEGKGTITVEGKDTVAEPLTYTGCKAFEAKENAAAKQWEEGAELKCTVKGGTGAVAGEIKLPALKSKLVNRVASENEEVLVRLEPEVGEVFVTLKLEGTECALAGSYEVKGKVLGRIPREQEAIMGNVLFETENSTGVSKVVQRFNEYELNNVVTTGVELKLGENPTAYESTEQVELEPVSNLRAPFGAH